MIFYRSVCAAALDLTPDQTIEAIDTIACNFQMPGAGMPDFRRHGVLMTKHGVYDLRHHLEVDLNPVLRQWRIFERNDFTSRGERAREHLAGFLDNLETVKIPQIRRTPRSGAGPRPRLSPWGEADRARRRYPHFDAGGARPFRCRRRLPRPTSPEDPTVWAHQQTVWEPGRHRT